MTTIASRLRDQAPSLARRAPFGLSGKLILLTVVFMMIAEIVIYVPALAGFRRSWVQDRVMGARMLVLALASADGTMPSGLEAGLASGVSGAQAVAVRGSKTRWIQGRAEQPIPAAVNRDVDLRDRPWWKMWEGLYRVMFVSKGGFIRVIAPGPPGAEETEYVEVILEEAVLKTALLEFSRDFLIISLLMSAATAAILYFALHLIVVRPVRRLSVNITGFAADPEDLSRVIGTSGRRDEIGAAEEALARMETALARELRQRRHLADLGLAVSKINHELRNMLTTAQLLGDRLGGINDPAVKRVAPRLIATLDRAISYCGATLAYGRASEPVPVRRQTALLPVITDQLHLTKLGDGHPIGVGVDVAPDLQLDADPEQLGRVLLNLIRNAVEALAKTPDPRIAISAWRRGGTVTIRVADNGPGIPDRIRTRIFSAFQASERSGGTGLGLPIADELVRLHGGTLALENAERGASFLITIPDRTA